MPKITTHKTETVTLDTLISRIATDYPDFVFVEGTRFSWRAGTRHVSFKKSDTRTRDAWALLHELGHAMLGHTDYRYDIELLQMEAAAWSQAHKLATVYDL